MHIIIQKKILLLIITYLLNQPLLAQLVLYKPNQLLVLTSAQGINTLLTNNLNSATQPFNVSTNLIKTIEPLHIYSPQQTMSGLTAQQTTNETSQWYRITTNKSSQQLTLMQQLQSNPAINHVQPNYIYNTHQPIIQPAHITPATAALVNQTTITSYNDPLASQQWALDHINYTQVWNVVSHETSPIVAIIDSGIDNQHPDLAPHIWHNPNEIANNNIDDDNNGYIDDIHGWDFYNNQASADDNNNHGTHVAGIVAAQTNNAIGIAGLSNHCQLMALKAANSYGQLTSESVATAIYYAINHQATVINLSFGAPQAYVPNEELIKQAVHAAIQANTHVVAAAGNQALDINQHNYIPATYPNVISVSSTTPDQTFANSYSNYGTSITLCAPGGSSTTGVLSTIPSQNYIAMTGTSMAAPHVSGALALLHQALPHSTPQQQLAALTTTATSLNQTQPTQIGAGLLNLPAALKKLDTIAPTLTHNPTTQTTLSNNVIIINATTTDNIQSLQSPQVTLHYQPQYTHQTSPWQTTYCTTTATQTQCQLPHNNQAQALHYYLTATDWAQHTTVAPTTAPNTWYTMALTDTQPPNIYFLHQDTSIGHTSILHYSITDNSAIDTSSLNLTITTPTTTHHLTHTTDAITLTQTQLSIHLAALNLNASTSITIQMSLSDSQSNTQVYSQQLTLTQPLIITHPYSNTPGFVVGPTPITNQAYIQYSLSTPAAITLEAYTINGKQIWHSHYQANQPNHTTTGTHSIVWDMSAHNLPNGPYILLLTATTSTQQKQFKQRVIKLI